MIRKNLLKATIITTVIATMFTATACGKKAADNNTIQETKATVSTETKSVAAKELTKIEDKNDSIVAYNSTAETASNNEETNTLESASDSDNSLNEENNNSDENTSSDESADTGNESDSASDNNDGGNTEENNVSNGDNTDSQPSDNEQGNEETPSPEPDETPADPEPSPTPDNSKGDSDNGNGYDFSTVEGPNGPMYAFTGDNYLIAGQDVNQGSNVDCPYALKTVTTRNAFLSNYGENAFRNITGYYYIAVDEYGSEVPRGQTSVLPYYNELGWNYTESRKIGTFSCGDVWFRAYIGW